MNKIKVVDSIKQGVQLGFMWVGVVCVVFTLLGRTFNPCFKPEMNEQQQQINWVKI